MGQVTEIPGRPYMKSAAEIFLARGGSGGGGGVPGECLISYQVAADALRPSYMVTTRYLQIQSWDCSQKVWPDSDPVTAGQDGPKHTFFSPLTWRIRRQICAEGAKKFATQAANIRRLSGEKKSYIYINYLQQKEIFPFKYGPQVRETCEKYVKNQ